MIVDNTIKSRSLKDCGNTSTNSLSLRVLKQFRLIFKATQQHSKWVESQYGVTSAQLWAMWEISKKAKLKVTDLAMAMSIHHSTACSLLDKLVKKGLVERKRVSKDQRIVTLQLTEEGLTLMNQNLLAPQGLLQHAIFELPENVLNTLESNLALLVNTMDIVDYEAAMQPLSPQSSSPD